MRNRQVVIWAALLLVCSRPLQPEELCRDQAGRCPRPLRLEVLRPMARRPVRCPEQEQTKEEAEGARDD